MFFFVKTKIPIKMTRLIVVNINIKNKDSNRYKVMTL
jgi:hypothetical protein